MQFFDFGTPSHRRFFLNSYTLDELSEQHWQLAKIRVEHDCLEAQQHLEGQIVLRSSARIDVEIDWTLIDTGHSLELHFKGLGEKFDSGRVLVKGANIVNQANESIPPEALQLYLDGILANMLPDIEQQIKQYLNVWDYATYQD